MKLPLTARPIKGAYEHWIDKIEVSMRFNIEIINLKNCTKKL